MALSNGRGYDAIVINCGKVSLLILRRTADSVPALYNATRTISLPKLHPCSSPMKASGSRDQTA